MVLISAFAINCIPLQALSLHDARELCKQHRYKILAIVSTAVIYMYSHKFIEKAIYEYTHQDEIIQKDQAKPTQDYGEASADIFIKSAKLIGTIFKVFRALTCGEESRWLDEFAGLA
jgi:hypothetical protein